MVRPVIISCAVTGGSVEATRINRHVPITPRQIADECIAAARAGAHITHIHVREPDSGKATLEPKYFREVVERIRDSGVDVLINLSTGFGGIFIPSGDDPRRASTDSNITTPEERVGHVLELKPDLCSLDVVSMNLDASAFINVPQHLDRMVNLITAAGVKAELEVFDLGHLRLAADMVRRGLVKAPPLFQLCLGVNWGAPADTETMLLMRNQLPVGAVWAGFGISRLQFPMVAQAVILGGHVRVGLEDNLYLAQGQLSPGNAPLVERAVQIINAVGERPATMAEARQLLGL
jgi:uncharacterized protein (DUF849 family)